jgi:hypothetical protein
LAPATGEKRWFFDPQPDDNEACLRFFCRRVMSRVAEWQSKGWVLEAVPLIDVECKVALSEISAV